MAQESLVLGTVARGPGPAANRALHERQLIQLRTNMSKPHVVDSELARQIDKVYRLDAVIGSGSTADAIRYERLTGERLFGRWHSQKGNDMIVRLEDWLKNNPTATAGDRAATTNVIKDLKNALGEYSIGK